MPMNKSIVSKGILFYIVKPFAIPIIIIVTLLIMVCTITDILYVGYNHEENIDMEAELKYYDAEIEYEKDEMKELFASVWDFVSKIFGENEMSEYADWPVERRIYNYQLFWKKRSTNNRCLNISYGHRYSSS